MRLGTFDTRADFILAQLKHDGPIRRAHKRGRFYSGYCTDLVEESTVGDSVDVDLARNGLMQYLPQGVMYDEDFLRKAKDQDDLKERQDALKKLKEVNESFFSFFDTIFFNRELDLARTVSRLELKKESLLLDAVYGIKIDDIRNQYVKSLARLRLYSQVVKGNMGMIAFYVACILNERVDLERRRFIAPHDNSHKSAVYAAVRFVVRTNGLSLAEYRRRMDDYEVFFQSLYDWFLPYDIEADYCIKDRSRAFNFKESGSLILDYNTQL